MESVSPTKDRLPQDAAVEQPGMAGFCVSLVGDTGFMSGVPRLAQNVPAAYISATFVIS